MDERLITQALQDQARKDIPDDMNLWPEVQEKLGRASRTAARSRVTWIVAAILTLLAMSAIAYAAARLLQGGLDPGLQGASESDLVTVLNLKKTIDGQTVTLDYAYADSNRISYSVTLNGSVPLDTQYNFNNVQLSDDAGHQFETMFGGGGGGGGGGGNSTTMDYSSNISNSVDASVITGTPDKLNLHLTVQIDKHQLLPTSEATSEATESANVITPSEMVTPLDPVTFDFSVPFIQGQVVEPQQSVTANGITLRLDRLVIAPSLTRGTVCIDPTPTESKVPFIALTVNDKPIELGDVPSAFTPLPAGTLGSCYDMQINQSLYQQAGTWKLTVNSLATYMAVRVLGTEDGGAAYNISGAADAIARVRDRIEPTLKSYGIDITVSEDSSLNFNVPANPDTQSAVNTLVNDNARTETPGPWVFTFDVPPAQ